MDFLLNANRCKRKLVWVKAHRLTEPRLIKFINKPRFNDGRKIEPWQIGAHMVSIRKLRVKITYH